MPKEASSLELAVKGRPPGVPLTRWLYQELRVAILDRRLPAGSRLPATRDVARQYQISRGTVVAVFEQLQDEGFIVSRVGSGTRVNDRLPDDGLNMKRRTGPATRLRGSLVGRTTVPPARPFRPHEPAIAEFPIEVWARIASKRLRRASTTLLVGRDLRGYQPLREAIASYLASSRGVKCSADEILIVSGAQQGLDLFCRCLLKRGDAVWMEDPGYFGATRVLRAIGARIVPVPVDDRGLDVIRGRQLCERARAVYLTPAHQFPLGMTMTVDRRLAILAWARHSGALIIEDDYDSEYRFEGAPVPALHGLDQSGSVVLIGSFNKTLFPSLRIGYLVAPPQLVDQLVAFRLTMDLHMTSVDQAILCDFMVEGHFGRHIRRMRSMYAGRLGALHLYAKQYLAGLLDVQPIRAGLNTSAFLRNDSTSRQAEQAAAGRGVEAMALSRFTLKRTDFDGLLLGFAAFPEEQIREGVITLATALDTRRRNA